MASETRAHAIVLVMMMLRSAVGCSLLVAALGGCPASEEVPDAGGGDAGPNLPPAKKAKKVAVANGFTVALTTDGEVRVFGWDDYAGLGVDPGNALVPTTIPALATGVVDIATNYQTSCAAMSNGSVKCWGDNRFGAVGDGTETDRATPVDVSGLTGVKSISAGADFMCAAMTAGGAKCWGRNEYRQLGAMTPDPSNSNSFLPSLVPIDVAGLAGTVKSVHGGFEHACAIMMTGTLKCWGKNVWGQLGNGLGDGLSLPRNFGDAIPDVMSLAGVVDVAPSVQHTVAVLSTGAVKAWGKQENGNLGNGEDSTFAPDVTSPADVTGLTTGGTAVAGTCAIVGGNVWCWVDNLGDGSTGDEARSLVPRMVPGITDAVQISTGLHTCVVLASGRMKCWGDNTNGGLGIGVDQSTGMSSFNTPQDVLAFE